ncbi:MAG: ubiquinol-cytochrome c reductase iron-sulfur subunit [Candidatus Methylomirabilales bacterium]
MGQWEDSGSSGERTDSQGITPGRRRFIALAFGAITSAIAGIIGVPLASFFALPALKRSERRWLEVGPVSDLVEGQITKVVTKPLASQVWPHNIPSVAIYVVNHGGGKCTLYHIHCTHVGCPVRWNSQAGRFFSPCHGGVFDREGRVLAGPPPRPLDRYEHKIENGILYAGRLYKVNEKLEFAEWHHA